MNCLITKDGQVINCSGGRHDYICRFKLQTTLRGFLYRHHGVRIKIGRHKTIAIEYRHKPTDAQAKEIRKILRSDNYYVVILSTHTLSKCRPIRRIKL